jgi:hypothetical protein
MKMKKLSRRSCMGTSVTLALAGEVGFVTDPIDWKYSSARNYAEDESILKIDNEGIILGML